MDGEGRRLSVRADENERARKKRDSPTRPAAPSHLVSVPILSMASPTVYIGPGGPPSPASPCVDGSGTPPCAAAGTPAERRGVTSTTGVGGDDRPSLVAAAVVAG
jgi:hypothetical protein